MQMNRLLMPVFYLSSGSREKLWICMEYCGGGSLQDIYHGTSRLVLTSVPFGSFLQRREINNKQSNGDRLVLAGHSTCFFLRALFKYRDCHFGLYPAVLGRNIQGENPSCAMPCRSFIVISPSEDSFRVVS